MGWPCWFKPNAAHTTSPYRRDPSLDHGRLRQLRRLRWPDARYSEHPHELVRMERHCVQLLHWKWRICVCWPWMGSSGYSYTQLQYPVCWYLLPWNVHFPIAKWRGFGCSKGIDRLRNHRGPYPFAIRAHWPPTRRQHRVPWRDAFRRASKLASIQSRTNAIPKVIVDRIRNKLQNKIWMFCFCKERVFQVRQGL